MRISISSLMKQSFILVAGAFLSSAASADICTFEASGTDRVSIKIETFAGGALLTEVAGQLMVKKEIEADSFSNFKAEMKKIAQSRVLSAKECAVEDQLKAQCSQLREVRTCLGKNENKKLVRMFNLARTLARSKPTSSANSGKKF